MLKQERLQFIYEAETYQIYLFLSLLTRLFVTFSTHGGSIDETSIQPVPCKLIRRKMAMKMYKSTEKGQTNTNEKETDTKNAAIFSN